MIAVLLKVGSGASLICTCTKKTQHILKYASIIVSNPRVVGPLDRLDESNVHRRVVSS